LQLNDADFLSGFEACTLDEFHHRDHLRMTWLLIRRDGLVVARASIEEGIKRVARNHSRADKYHQTMTEFWVDAVAYFVAHGRACDSFDEFLTECPQVLDASLPFRHWSRSVIMGGLARSRWVPPDVLPLPWVSRQGTCVEQSEVERRWEVR
jgi:hypothetical protein